MRDIAGLALDLVFAEPVVGAFVVHHSAAVRIDGHPPVIQPELARMKGFVARGRLFRNGSHGRKREQNYGA